MKLWVAEPRVPDQKLEALVDAEISCGLSLIASLHHQVGIPLENWSSYLPDETRFTVNRLTTDENEFRYVLDVEKTEVIWFIRLTPAILPRSISTPAKQMFLWRSQNPSNLYGFLSPLGSSLVWSLCLVEGICLLSDTLQTDASMRFWRYVPFMSFSKGLAVNIMDRSLGKFYTYNDFKALAKELPLWGNAAWFQNRSILLIAPDRWGPEGLGKGPAGGN